MTPGQLVMVRDDELFRCGRVNLRLVRMDDCTERYVGWLRDAEINRYLETRWREQTLASVREFVAAVREDPDSYLFAILDAAGGAHVGNIKLGPINRNHGYADVSYFIGERSAWGKGFATDAIRGATRIGFERFGLARLQAGVYEANVGSVRALEKVGYRHEGRFRKQLVAEGGRQDHLFLGILREEFVTGEAHAVRQD